MCQTPDKLSKDLFGRNAKRSWDFPLSPVEKQSRIKSLETNLFILGLQEELQQARAVSEQLLLQNHQLECANNDLHLCLHDLRCDLQACITSRSQERQILHNAWVRHCRACTPVVHKKTVPILPKKEHQTFTLECGDSDVAEGDIQDELMGWYSEPSPAPSAPAPMASCCSVFSPAVPMSTPTAPSAAAAATAAALQSLSTSRPQLTGRGVLDAVAALTQDELISILCSYGISDKTQHSLVIEKWSAMTRTSKTDEVVFGSIGVLLCRALGASAQTSGYGVK